MSDYVGQQVIVAHKDHYVAHGVVVPDIFIYRVDTTIVSFEPYISSEWYTEFGHLCVGKFDKPIRGYMVIVFAAKYPSDAWHVGRKFFLYSDPSIADLLATARKSELLESIKMELAN